MNVDQPERTTVAVADADEATLAGLGYKQELPRVLRFWTNWAIGFAFISPIVGLYTVVSLEAQTGGPAWVWTLPVVVIGQLLVAFVMAELAGRWPVAGGIYQWSVRLLGTKFGWWTGWIYMWALIVTLSLVAYGGGTFLADLVGIKNVTPGQNLALGLLVLASFTLVNAIGLNLLRYLVNVGIICELTATLVIGAVLLAFFRKQPVSALFDSGGVAHSGSYLPAFVASLAIAGWVILGFDACGAVAEETIDAVRRVPRAVIMSIVAVGFVDILAAVALMLAQPDLGAVVDGSVTDPVSGAVVAGLGAWAAKPFLAIVLVAFLSCGLAVQAAVVRVIYAYSRDSMFPFAAVWRKVAGRNNSPVYGVLLTAVLAGAIFAYAKTLTVLVGFSTGGYYLAYLCPLVGFLYARRTGRLDAASGAGFRLGRWGWPVAGLATAWTVFEFINIAWPRNQQLPWYQNWAVEVAIGVLGGIGLGYFLATRPDRKFAVAPEEASGAVVEVQP